MAQVSSFSGAFPVIPGGMVELGYSAITTPGTVTSTTAGTGTEIIAPLTVACDGSPIMVEFYSPAVQAPVSGSVSGTVNISLFQDGSENIRFWGQQNSEAFNGQQNPVHLQARLTPTAGTHSFGVKGYLNAAGTAIVSAGNGASTGTAPAFLRVSKVVQQNDGLKPFWNPPLVTQVPGNGKTGDQVVRVSGSVYEPYYYTGATNGWKQLGNSTIICTSTTRPASPFQGQTIYETDTDYEFTYTGSAWMQTGGTGAWTTWTTPTLWQGTATPNVAKTVNYAKYIRVGRLVTVSLSVTVTGAGTSGQEIQIRDLPFAAASNAPLVGAFRFLDAGNTNYSGANTGNGTDTGIRFYVSGNGNPMGANPTFALANGDVLQCTVTYEAAS